MQNTSDKNTVKKTSWRRHLALWIFAVAVVGGTAMALWNMKFNKFRFHETRYGVTVTDKATEETADKARESAIAKTMVVRDAWRSWAKQHQSLLIQMLTASPNDKQSMMRVYHALPSTPAALNVDNMFIMPAPDNLEKGAISFTWQPLDKLNVADTAQTDLNPKDAARNKMFKEFIAQARQKNFSEYRDIELSKSVTLGGTKLTLWVSGRVTEESRVRQFKPGGRAWTDGPKKELMPPYDFLKVVPTTKMS